MATNNLRVGQIFRDNDPRMKGRLVRVVMVHPNGATYRRCFEDGCDLTPAERDYTALAHRFYFDGKTRKNGFAFVRQESARIEGSTES